MSNLNERKRVLVCTDTRLSIVDAPLQTREAFLQYIVTKGNNVWMHLVADAKAAGFVSDDDIMLLWQEGVLALEDIKGVVSDELLLPLLEKKDRIRERDAYYIFQRWLYRTESFPFSGETLRRWVKNSNIIDGKIQSLMAIALHKTTPELISFDDIAHTLSLIVAYQPESHGIHRLLLLALEMADQDPDKQTLAMNMFVEVCAILYFREQSIFDFLLDIVKQHEAWYETVRSIGLQQLRSRIADTIAELQKGATNI